MAKSPTAFGSAVASRKTRPAELHVRLDPEPGAAAHAREGLEVFSPHLSERRYADLRVIVTELVTNSVKYGPGNPIRLSVTLDRSGWIRGEVRDGGTGGVRMRAPGPLGGGLGLLIVEALADWGVEPGTSNVWFEFDGHAD